MRVLNLVIDFILFNPLFRKMDLEELTNVYIILLCSELKTEMCLGTWCLRYIYFIILFRVSNLVIWQSYTFNDWNRRIQISSQLRYVLIIREFIVAVLHPTFAAKYIRFGIIRHTSSIWFRCRTLKGGGSPLIIIRVKPSLTANQSYPTKSHKIALIYEKLSAFKLSVSMFVCL